MEKARTSRGQESGPLVTTGDELIAGDLCWVKDVRSSKWTFNKFFCEDRSGRHVKVNDLFNYFSHVSRARLSFDACAFCFSNAYIGPAHNRSGLNTRLVQI